MTSMRGLPFALLRSERVIAGIGIMRCGTLSSSSTRNLNDCSTLLPALWEKRRLRAMLPGDVERCAAAALLLPVLACVGASGTSTATHPPTDDDDDAESDRLLPFGPCSQCAEVPLDSASESSAAEALCGKRCSSNTSPRLACAPPVYVPLERLDETEVDLRTPDASDDDCIDRDMFDAEMSIDPSLSVDARSPSSCILPGGARRECQSGEMPVPTHTHTHTHTHTQTYPADCDVDDAVGVLPLPTVLSDTLDDVRPRVYPPTLTLALA
jgi:hypothetical protein